MIRPSLPATAVREPDQKRIDRLEGDLVSLQTNMAVLEKVVDNMVSLRQDDRTAMKELGERMEKSVASMAEEIKRQADRTATADRDMIAEQAKGRGAKEATSYVVATLLTVFGLFIGLGGLIVSFQAGKNSTPREEAPYNYETRILP